MRSKRSLLRRPLFLLGILFGLGLAGLGVVSLAVQACTGWQLGRAADTGADVVDMADIPAVNEPAVAAWMRHAAANYRAMHAEITELRQRQIAAGQTPRSENLSWQEILMGLASTGVAVVASRKFDANQERRHETSLKDVAVVLGKFAAREDTPSPSEVAAQLSHELPGEEVVAAAEVAPEKLAA